MKTRMTWMVFGICLMAALTVRAEVELSIRGSDTFGEELGPKLVAAFREQHPDSAIELESLGSVSGIAALLEVGWLRARCKHHGRD